MYKIKIGAIWVCALLFLLAAAACGAEDTRSGPVGSVEPALTTSDQAENPAPRNGEHSPIADDGETAVEAFPAQLSMEHDMGIMVGLQWFPIWQDAAELIEALGDDHEVHSAPSCVFEGYDREFAYDGYYVFTNPDGDRDLWYSVYLMSDTYSTARGIRVGSTLDEIIDAYGERYFWEGENILTYSISGIEGDIASPCIQFTFDDGIVSAIEIYYPTNVT